MSQEFAVETGLIVLSRDGCAQFGRRDFVTGWFHSEPDGRRIADAVGAVELDFDMVH
ncbi:hypothetical protein AWB68_02418 [Caballeronia choica]|jgi:hypothetical protein|uniref:Uncharacterized protein n=1 Tax=Caballeronia choica TaxID=326476 RepID=A0A158HX80_9BURK|nr:hypothetical protein AWB68_02418 [Caballeronia choica]